MAIATGLAVFFLVQLGVNNLWFLMPTLSTEIILINVLVTSGIYAWLFRTTDPRLFVNFYLLSIVIKLIFFSFFLLMIRLINPQNLTANAVLILGCYFIFTILEVLVLFLRVRP